LKEPFDCTFETSKKSSRPRHRRYRINHLDPPARTRFWSDFGLPRDQCVVVSSWRVFVVVLSCCWS
jgi:hypothetical protein